MATSSHLGRSYLPTKETLTVLVLLFALVLVFQLATSTFITKGNILDILREASKLCIISFGMAIVIAGGGIDLSIGHIAGFSAITATTLLTKHDMGICLSLLSGLSVGALFGLFNGLFVARLGISSFIVTLGTQWIILGIRYWITDGNIIMFLPDSYTIIGNGKILTIPIPIFIMLFIGILCFLLMESTVFGRRIESTGRNLLASWLSGIQIRSYTVLTFVLAGLFSSIAGIIHTSHMSVVSVDIGDGFLLDALTVAVFSVVIYGRFKTVGVFLVTLLFISLTNGLTMIGVNPFAVFLVKGCLLLIALTVNMVLQSDWLHHLKFRKSRRSLSNENANA